MKKPSKVLRCILPLMWFRRGRRVLRGEGSGGVQNSCVVSRRYINRSWIDDHWQTLAALGHDLGQDRGQILASLGRDLEPFLLIDLLQALYESRNLLVYFYIYFLAVESNVTQKQSFSYHKTIQDSYFDLEITNKF